MDIAELPMTVQGAFYCPRISASTTYLSTFFFYTFSTPRCTDDDIFFQLLLTHVRRDGRLRHAKIQMNLTQKSQKYVLSSSIYLLHMLSLSFKIYSLRKHTEMICFATGRENDLLVS